MYDALVLPLSLPSLPLLFRSRRAPRFFSFQEWGAALTKCGGRRGALCAKQRNAVSWVNANHSAALAKMVSSMPRRMRAVVEAKGAMTPY